MKIGINKKKNYVLYREIFFLFLFLIDFVSPTFLVRKIIYKIFFI